MNPYESPQTIDSPPIEERDGDPDLIPQLLILLGGLIIGAMLSH